MTELTLTVELTISAPIEAVFDAWLDADKLKGFMLPGHDMPAPKITLDPKLGGEFEIIMMDGENAIRHTGEYLEIDRPNALTFTWLSPYTLDGSTVYLTFESIDDAHTRVVLRHDKFPTQSSCDSHRNGWTRILACLAETA